MGATYGSGTYGSGLYGGEIIVVVEPPPTNTGGGGVLTGEGSGQYQLRLYDTNGVQVAVFDDWNSTYFYNKINGFGYHTISIAGDDERVALFAVDAIIEVRHRDISADHPWHTEYVGFHRTSQDFVSSRGAQLFTSFGRSFEDLIHRRAVAYPAGSAGAVKTGPADDVMKQFVRENAGAGATIAAGRITDGVTLGLTVQGNSSQGPLYAGSEEFRNLLDVVSDIGTTHSVDWDIVWNGVAGFDFRTYYPRKGTDRTGAGVAPPVVFSLDHANMIEPYATESHVDEVNAVLVLGQGEGADRVFVETTDNAAILASPWNRVEKTHDARNVEDTAALTHVGHTQLTQLVTRKALTFRAMRSASTIYGRDYFIGDLVLARFRGAEVAKKITGVETTVAEGRETIRIHFEGDL